MAKTYKHKVLPMNEEDLNTRTKLIKFMREHTNLSRGEIERFIWLSKKIFEIK